MEGLEIRVEETADVAAVRAVVEAAFGRPQEARFVELARESEYFAPALALVAVAGGKVVGHIMTSYVLLTGEAERQVLGMAPVSVIPEMQGAGIGSALIRESLRIADTMGEPLVVLLGHPEYYPRFGFEPGRAHGIEPPFPQIPDAAWMVKLLGAYHSAVRGRITYPAAFDGTW